MDCVDLIYKLLYNNDIKNISLECKITSRGERITNDEQMDQTSLRVNITNMSWIAKLLTLIKQIKLVNWNTTYQIDKVIPDCDNNFLSERISNWIKKQKLYHHYVLQHKTIGNINMFSINKIPIKLLIHVMKICTLLNNLANTKQHVPNITIILTPFEKQFGKAKILHEDNVNTGVSYKNNIVIWREEEMLKVLIHELIHNYKLDFGYDYIRFKNVIKINKSLNNIRHNDKNNIIINEAYTESMATIIFCVYFSVVFKLDINNIIVKEIWHSFIQTARILKYFGFNTIEEFTGEEPSNAMFVEKTNVFSYYVIKSILFFKLCRTIRLFDSDNKNNEFIELITFDDSYKKLINKIIKILIQDPYIMCDIGLTMTLLYKKIDYMNHSKVH
jgi:hypothetical protein